MTTSLIHLYYKAWCKAKSRYALSIGDSREKTMQNKEYPHVSDSLNAHSFLHACLEKNHHQVEVSQSLHWQNMSELIISQMQHLCITKPS